MSVDHRTVLFFDASCLVAAAGSPTGGSGFLLSLCQRGLLRAAVSQPVLLEAERNVLAHLKPDAAHAYHRLVAITPMMLVPVPEPGARRDYRDVVGEKDDHVVAAAIAARAPFLITLDKPLAERVNQAGWGLQALAPGDFIKGVLPQHRDYQSIR